MVLGSGDLELRVSRCILGFWGFRVEGLGVLGVGALEFGV